MKYYAIAKGRIPCIVNTWAECKTLTDGYAGSRFKCFNIKEEAEAYVSQNKPKLEVLSSKIVEGTIKKNSLNAINVLMKPINDIVLIEEPEYVYTDGSCSNNGRANAIAGIGVYFKEDDPRNVSERVQGKQSNNTAELSAIRKVYEILRQDILSGKYITIVTDSEYAIRCLTSYGEKCAKKLWKDPIPNKELVKELYELYSKLPNIQFIHINAHTGKQDKHSLGNEGADKLANQAIGLEACPYVKIYLNVPFSQKDHAKNLGAKWDPAKKKWYIFDNIAERETLLKLFSVV
jgi:ribonuclease HI